MATTKTPPTAKRPGRSTYSGGAVATIAFAGIMMVLVGVLHALQGIVALVNDTFFVYGEEYVFEFDLTTWGWTHLLVGGVVAAAGIALFRGAVWARVVAVVLASISLIASFVWLPYYPVWSLLLMALDVLVIWAVTAHGRDITRV